MVGVVEVNSTNLNDNQRRTFFDQNSPLQRITFFCYS